MAKTKVKEITSDVLKDAIIQGIQDKKGHNIVVIDLRGFDSAVTDFFVVCHGDSSTQVEAIAKSIRDVVLDNLHQKPWHEEGKTNAEWVLLDYVDVVAHVFYRDAREFYNIEDLWGDAPIEKIEDEN